METLPFAYDELRVNNKAYMACFSCRRKKTRCDMQLPICGLCQRTGCDCTFPKKRKTPRQPKSRLEGAQRLKAANTQTLERLLELLKAQLIEDHDNSESASLTNQAETSPDSPSNFDHQLPEQLGSSPGTESDCFVTRSKTRELRSSDAYLSPPVLDDHSTINTDLLDSECPVHTIDIPKGLVGELIDLYFDKIQAWLPMLNRPRFYARYMNGDAGAITSLEGYSVEQAMIFNGIFALSARHSHNPYFDGVEQKDRGRQFAERANALHRVGISMGLTNLAYLHGCILLAFYSYTSGPCRSGWVLAGLCVRLAYDLGMNNLDDNSGHVSLSTSEWVEKEELRRAWWLVWELDAFGSTLLRRPYAIDRRRINVLLPVSDEAWFLETPIESALLLTKPSETWKSLQNSQNQDPRAWFLIANYLMTTVHDMLHTEGISETEKQELADSITCFSLSLPKHCQLSAASLIFDSQSFSHSNWIICLQLMLLSARQGIDLLEVAAAARQGSVFVSRPFRGRELAAIVACWAPQNICVSHPFVACKLLSTSPSISSQTQLVGFENFPLNQETLRLVLEQYAAIWALGGLLLEIKILLERPCKLTHEEKELASNFHVLFAFLTTASECPQPSRELVHFTEPDGQSLAISRLCQQDLDLPLQFPLHSQSILELPIETAFEQSEDSTTEHVMALCSTSETSSTYFGV